MTWSAFHFIRPLWLLLIPLAAGIWRWECRQQDPARAWRTVMDRDLLKALTLGGDSQSRWRSTVLLAGWILGALAVAGPTWKPEPSPFADDPVPVMLLLKAGETMSQADLLPSRLQRAQLKIADLSEERKGQPLGLIAYAGSAHLVLPPTRDTAIVSELAAEISPRIMPRPGDELSEALQLAAETLGDRGGSIVVVADTVAESQMEQLAEFRAGSRLPVFVLGVARDDTPEWDALQQAASALRGNLTAITPGPEDVQGLIKSVARTPQLVSEADAGTRWAEMGWWIVPLLALLSLLPFRRVQSVSALAPSTTETSS